MTQNNNSRTIKQPTLKQKTIPNKANVSESLETLKGLIQLAFNSDAGQQVPSPKTYQQVISFIDGIIASSNLGTKAAFVDSKEREAPPISVLTKREQQVLQLIANGYANKNIASKLNISIRTAEGHRSNLMRKLGIKTTANLVKYAISQGLA